MAFLVLVEEELTEIHDPAYGRLGCRYDLNKVQFGCLGLAARVFDRHNAQVVAIGSDQPDFRYNDVPVYTILLVSGYTLVLQYA